MNGKAWSIRWVVIVVLTAMFFFSSAHVLVSRAMLRDAAQQAEKQGIRHLTEVVARDQLHRLRDKMIDLGQATTRSLPPIAPEQIPKQRVIDQLSEPFVKGFPLVREVDLIELRLYDLDLTPIATSRGRGNGWADPELPHFLRLQASGRNGIERLQALGGLWTPANGVPLYSVLIPVGGLRPSAYLEVVVDPLFNLSSIGETIGMVVEISNSIDPPQQYSSDEFKMAVEYQLRSEDGEDAYRITLLLDRSSLISQLNEGFYRATLFFLALSLILYLIAMRVFSITLIRPVDRMIASLGEEGDSGTTLNNMPIDGASELRRLASAFNQMIERVRQSVEELRQLSINDSLTGIANRRRFDEVLQREWERARRDDTPLTLLLIDVDYFKQYNDTYGHQQGDEALRLIARLLVGVGRRPADLVARYGGEEFVVILPGVDQEGALIVAERIRSGCLDLRIPHSTSAVSPSISLSIGLATVKPASTGLTTEGAIARADHALYSAKQAGRNRVVVAE